MSTTTLLHHILMLSFKDKVFIAEQIMHSIQAENIDNYFPKEDDITGVISEEMLVLPEWQKQILQQRLESVEQGNTVTDEEAHKIFEQCLA
ncbi:MAG: addiction module protein [Prevotellaceae bacterium]|jgi:hypothetical protein|nr:addiction module protein [Prevotellaceae bacterium]